MSIKTITLFALAAFAMIATFVAAQQQQEAEAASHQILPEPFINLEFLSFLGLEKQCLRRFGRFDLFGDIGCFKAAISKALGYAIIAGSLTVKVPQIVAIIKAKSAEGLSKGSCYAELMGYLLHAIYHIVLVGSPFSAYGESVTVAFQSAAVMFAYWFYSKTSVAEMLAVALGLVGVSYGALSFEKNVVLTAATVIFSAARFLQIIEIVKRGHVGNLAFMTLFMQFAGSSARVFTTTVEVKDPFAVGSVLVSAALNTIILAQYFLMPAPKKATTKKD